MKDTLPTWDLFVSYASEDGEFVRALVLELRRLELRVWFDEQEVPDGARTHVSIAIGVAQSRRAVAVLSPHYFGKHYTSRVELPALLAKEASGTDIVIPVWLNTTEAEVLTGAPLLADRRPVRSDGRNVTDVATRLASAIDPVGYRAQMTRRVVRDLIAEVVGPVQTVTWQGRVIRREHDLAMCLDPSRDVTIPTAVFYQGWDGTSLDVEWWDEFSGEFLAVSRTPRKPAQTSVVLIASEHPLWCEPSEFSQTQAAFAAFTRVHRDVNLPESLLTLDLTVPLHGATWKRLVLATLGANPTAASIRSPIERARVLLIDGDVLIDEASGNW